VCVCLCVRVARLAPAPHDTILCAHARTLRYGATVGG